MALRDDNVIQQKSYAFAIRIVKLYRHLSQEKKEFVLSKQLLRSGTSIGANLEEGIGGQSRKDFAAKVNISYKEARESRYWIRLLRDTDYLEPKEAESILNDCEEVVRILAAIVKTLNKD
jgi:four helix bundle protein